VVPLLNRPFLAYQLALLRAHGVTDVILACSYRVEDVRRALGEAEHLGVRLRYVVEAEPLGTGGGVRNAADLARGTVWVLNGDVLTDADLTAMRRLHESRGSRTTIFLMPVEDPRAYGLVELDGEARLTRFREKPTADEPITTNTINAGIYLIDAALLSRIPTGTPVSIEREFFPALIADGIPCYGWTGPSPTYWRDIGSLTAYHAAQLDLLSGRARTTLPPPGAPRDGSWIAATARIAPTARIKAPSVIGEHVEVAPDADIGPHTVIGDHTRIADGARVESSILWDHVTIGEQAHLAGAIVPSHVTIGPHAHLTPGVALEPNTQIPAQARITP
jgi:NDP-sugar pyrophosphorylase family protein